MRRLGTIVLLISAGAAAAVAIGLRERAAESAPTGTVAGEVAVRQDGEAIADRSGVVVYLESVPGPAPAPTAHGEIRQRDLTFSPALTVVVKGTTIDFPNDDRVFHNVFSLSEAARFDLGLYRSGASKSVTFRRAGVIDVFCNIHPQMVAKIKVLDSATYAVTGPNGRFRIDRVPPGEYPIVAWQAHGEEVRGRVRVTGGRTAHSSLTVVRGEAPRRHLRKDRTPYGRYR